MLAERETFTSKVLAKIYRLIFNLYRDLVPCFVIARGGSKKLVGTPNFMFQDECVASTKFGSHDKEPHSHFYTVKLWVKFKGYH